VMYSFRNGLHWSGDILYLFFFEVSSVENLVTVLYSISCLQSLLGCIAGT
jgi:hypothetical protein